MNKSIPLWKVAGLALAAYLIFGGAKGCDLDFPFDVITPDGPMAVMVVRESENITPAIAALGTALRVPPAADFFKAGKHTVSINDPQDKDENGKTPVLLEKFQPYQPTGELLLVAPPDKLIHRQPLPATAQEVVDVVKSKGG